MPDRAYRLARDAREAAAEHLGSAWHELQAARGSLLDVPDAAVVAGRVAGFAAGVHRLWVDLAFDETAEGPTPRECRREEG